MNVFRYDDYKFVLKDLIEQRKRSSKYLTFSYLAEKILVQRSYLSQVFNGDADLNADQLFLVLEELNIKKLEREYILLLLEYNRSYNHLRKEYLKKKIDEILKIAKETSSALESDQVSPNNLDMTYYYGNPNYSIVHMYLTIKEFRDKPEKVRAQLGLSKIDFQSIIKVLVNLGFISYVKNKIELGSKKLHLSKDNPLAKIHASQFRNKAIEFNNSNRNENDYFFTATFSTDDKVKEEIREEFLKFISKASKGIEAKKPKKVYQINFDLFSL